MRFTVLLTDKYDQSDMRLLLDAGFAYQAYVSCWDKVFTPDTPPVLEYNKIARLFKRESHVVLAVMIENYNQSSLAVAHHAQSSRDIRSWMSTRPSAQTMRIADTIDQAVLTASPARRLYGLALLSLRQDFLCCARIGVVSIERVRHSESPLQSKIRILATEIDKHIGSVKFGFDDRGTTAQMHIGALKLDVGSRKPTLSVYTKNRRLQSFFANVATVSGLLVTLLVPTGTARALISGDTFHNNPAHRLHLRAFARKRKRIPDEDLALLFGPLTDGDAAVPSPSKRRNVRSYDSAPTGDGATLPTVLGKRKYDELGTA